MNLYVQVSVTQAIASLYVGVKVRQIYSFAIGINALTVPRKLFEYHSLNQWHLLEVPIGVRVRCTSELRFVQPEYSSQDMECRWHYRRCAHPWLHGILGMFRDTLGFDLLSYISSADLVITIQK